MQLFNLAQAELLRSNADRRHPFRYFWLATQSGFPEIRTVVKRKFEKDWSVIFFTDARSPKVEQIQNDRKVSALFYHPEKKLQIRMRGEANIIDKNDEAYATFFQQIQQSNSLKDYTTSLSPSSPIKDELEIIYGQDIHFLPIQIKPISLDILLLGKEKHLRCQYHLEGNEWISTRLVP